MDAEKRKNNDTNGIYYFKLYCFYFCRFYSICYPITYRRKRTHIRTYTFRAIISTWLVSAILGILPIIPVIPGDRYRIHQIGLTLSVKMDEFMLYEIIMLASLVIVCTLTISSYVLYIKRAGERRKALKKSDKSCSLSESVSATGTEPTEQTETRVTCRPQISTEIEDNTKKNQLATASNFVKKVIRKRHSSFGPRNDKDRRLWSSMAVVIAAFTLCYLPLIITQCFSHSDRINLSKYPETFDAHSNFVFNMAMFLSSRIVMCNSFVNGIIYSIMDKNFLRGLKEILRRS